MKQAPSKRLATLANLATSVTTWAEKWFPDSYIFAVLAVIAACLGATLIQVPFEETALNFGDGYWSLIPFTLQMIMVSVSGYVVASSPPASRTIQWVARLPKTGRGAVAYVALISMLTSLLNWAISLILSGLLVRSLARRKTLKMDYRAAGAAAYLGLGATWALGLSSSAAQLQANPESIPKGLLSITGVIPFQETIFLPQSIVLSAILIVISVLIAYASAPGENQAKTAEHLGIDLGTPPLKKIDTPTRPGDWLEHSPILTLLVVFLGCGWLWKEFQKKDALLAISNLNTYNFFFLMLGMLLCWRPKSFLNTVAQAVPSTTGLLIQFPLYGSIAFILTQAKGAGGSSLSHHLSQFFVSLSSHSSFPALMGAYSAILGFFVPSGGGKWLIEAPYLMEAAHHLKIHLGWTVQIYNASEALPNLINPFWMLPLLGILGLKAKDIIGYTFTQFIIHLPLVLFLLWLFAGTLSYQGPSANF